MFFRSLARNYHLRFLAHPLIRSLTTSDNNSDVNSAPNATTLVLPLIIGSLTTSDNNSNAPNVSLPKFRSLPAINATITSFSTVPPALPKFHSLPTINTITCLVYSIDAPIISGPAIKAISSLSILRPNSNDKNDVARPTITMFSSISSLYSRIALSDVSSLASDSLITLSARFGLVSSLAPYSLAISNPSRRGILFSRNYAWYRSYPKFKSQADKRPSQALDVTILNKDFAGEAAVTSIQPNGVVLEMKYYACHSDRPDSIKPNFRIHSLRTSYTKDGKLYNITKKADKTSPAELKLQLSEARKTINQDLASHKVAKEDLKKIWWDDGVDEMNFWSYSLLKHSWLSETEKMPDFASTTASLGMQVLNGSEEKDLRCFLQKKFAVGKYHKVADLQVALKEYFKAEVYPTFIGVASHHPCLYEIGVMHDKTTKKVVDRLKACF